VRRKTFSSAQEKYFECTLKNEVRRTAGETITLTAKPGYKFRSVSVTAVRTLAEATAQDLGKIADADAE